ncbi:hypothetical protein BaRGS_00040412 [Batillaria attramentaria]|uniref:WD repeat and HMG-box DNA-binding protein 1 n=1 Tax=Batillaria attramentaria TaxID=370345 RepID=A0ABD0J100_9CAEN
MKPMRYAHSEGHTDLCFDDSGRYILTCGTDESGRFFTATDANSVQASKFPDGSPDGLITRFTAPVSHMVLNSSGYYYGGRIQVSFFNFLTSPSDFTVKVWDVASSSHKVVREHKAPVLSIALDPKEQFMASSSCDGTVRVWRLDDQSEVKVFSVLSKCSDISSCLVPVEKEVQVYSRDAWELVDKISHPRLEWGALSMCWRCVLMEGTLLLAVWTAALSSLTGSFHNVVENGKAACFLSYNTGMKRALLLQLLAWNPSNSHQIAFCDKEGQLGVLDGVLSLVTENPLVISESVMEDSLTDAKGDGEEAVAPRPVVQVVEGFKPTPLQKPFQPGSTPEHLSSRFMKWNSVGVIRQYNTEEENSIDIDKLMCMHFGSWDNAKEWSATMPEGEVIQAVVLGEGWLAAATSARNVRIFTVGGVQRQLFSLPGPAVCLAAHGQRLLVVYHAGMGLPGEQNMACRILRVTSQKRPCEEGSLPLTPKATLSWIGFSAEGTPFFMDSEGIMRMKNASLGGIWTQVADTRENVKGKSDHYWIVGVNENPQQLRCIPCKGSRYPATLPRPAVTVLPFHLPLCDSGVEKSQYEEEYLRSMLFAQHLVRWGAEGYEVDEAVQQDLTRQQQTALMKLFALSARSEREFRAMEVCELMPDEHTLQLSIKYATRLKHMQLAQRISQLIHQREQEAQMAAGGEEEEVEDFRDYLSARHNTSETEWSTKSSIGTKRESEDEEDMEKNEDVEEEEKLSSGPMLNVKPKDKKSRQVSLARGNPFKVSSQQKDSGAPTRGSQVFDGMKKMKERGTVITPLPVSVKQTKSGQRKITVKLLTAIIHVTVAVDRASKPSRLKLRSLATRTMHQTRKNQRRKRKPSENEPSNKPASAFDLWMVENLGELEEEHPDKSREELSRLAAEKFRLWMQKAKAQSQTSSEATSGESDKKRKRPDEEDEADDTSAKMQKTASKPQTKKPLSQSTNSKLANFAFSSKS